MLSQRHNGLSFWCCRHLIMGLNVFSAVGVTAVSSSGVVERV